MREADGAQLAGLDVAGHLGERGKRHVHLTAEQVGDHRRSALVGHMHGVDAGLGLEQFTRQMLHAAIAWRADAGTAGLRLDPLEQLVQILGRYLGAGDEHQRNRGGERDRREVLDRVVVQLGVETGADGVRGRGLEQRVAVRRRLGHVLRAHRGACARAVVHDHGLAPLGAELVGNHAADHVSRAARWIRHDHAHGLGRVALRERGGDGGEGGGAGKRCQQHAQGRTASVHVGSPGFFESKGDVLFSFDWSGSNS